MKSKFFVLLFLLLSMTLLAADISFEASVDRSGVSIGSTATLSLTFGGIGSIERPQLPEIDGFDVRYLGPSTKMSIVNGQVSSSITHNYILIPLKEGSFVIPSITINHKGIDYSSLPVNIEVANKIAASGGGSQPQESYDLEDRAFIVAELGKNKAYVNEIIPLKVKLYVDNLGIRDIQYPKIPKDGIIVGDFSQPRQYKERMNGINYDVIEFSTDVFALRSGSIVFGPVGLNCNLIVEKRRRKSSAFDDDFFGSGFFGGNIFDNFFANYQRYPLNLSAPEENIEIKDLPVAGKPDNFNGAVGDFNFDVEISPKKVKVGDPITLKMVVSGDGNFKTVNLIDLNLGDDFKIYDPQVTSTSSGKLFEQVVIPKKSTINEMPAIGFSFFNPKVGEYLTITNEPTAIVVEGGTILDEAQMFESGDGGVTYAKDVVGEDIVYIKEDVGQLRRKDHYLHNKLGFIIFHFLIVFIAAVAAVVFLETKRLRTDSRYARRLQAPKKAKIGINRARHLMVSGKSQDFYNIAFKTLQEYLGDKFHLASAGITINFVDEIAVLGGIDKNIIDKMRQLFEACDMARFAAGAVDKVGMQLSFDQLREIVDYLERVKL
ncbi:MAG: protein BatD [Candidatus Omnitrophica bacterium]|nr:protein BatD [Candidatus Omnitrophota bacterium]